MKKILPVILLSFVFQFLNAQNVSFTDQNFKGLLVADRRINTNQDSEIQASEA